METVWELTVEKRGEGGIIATRNIETVTIRCGSEVWVIERVMSVWTGEVEAVRVLGRLEPITGPGQRRSGTSGPWWRT
jgi:hypothetical protein